MRSHSTIVIDRPLPDEPPKWTATSVFAWKPVWTEDEGLVWMASVWKITAYGKTIYSKAILPL